MPSLLAVSGLLIDRAFPPLEEDAATRRRALTMTAIVNLTRVAREHAVDAVVIVGGLFDDRSVGVRTLPAAMSVLESFDGRILIAPGIADPYSATGPYSTTDWGDRTHVWTSPEFTEGPRLQGAIVQGRARASTWVPTPPLPDADGTSPHVVIGEGLDPDASARWVSEHSGRHVITTGEPDAAEPGVTLLATINADPGQPFDQAVLLELPLNKPARETRLDLLEGTRGTIDLDISAADDTDTLASLVTRALRAAEPWSTVALTGTLRQGVLLPSTAGTGLPRNDVLLDESGLTYELALPESTDRTALAEFLRSISEGGGDNRLRHQAIAMGLTALRATSRELGEP